MNQIRTFNVLFLGLVILGITSCGKTESKPSHQLTAEVTDGRDTGSSSTLRGFFTPTGLLYSWCSRTNHGRTFGWALWYTTWGIPYACDQTAKAQMNMGEPVSSPFYGTFYQNEYIYVYATCYEGQLVKSGQGAQPMWLVFDQAGRQLHWHDCWFSVRKFT